MTKLLLLLQCLSVLVHAQHLSPTCSSRPNEGEILASPQACVDETTRCPYWARHGYCHSATQFMVDHCPQSCNHCARRKQQHQQPPAETAAMKHERHADEVMQRILTSSHGLPDLSSCHEMLRKCESLREQRITESECTTHSDFSDRYCRAACSLCEPILPSDDFVCPLNVQEPPAFDSPRDLLERINQTYSSYSQQQQQHHEVQQLSSQPTILVIDNFLSDAECSALIDCAAAQDGFVPTQDVQTRGKWSHYYRARLSSRTTCSDNDDARIADIYRRIETMTQVPHANTEPIQVVKYDVDHFHKKHHDYTEHQEGGPRVLTVLLYLNNHPTNGGGETNFPDAHNVTIVPRKGTAVIWSNTFGIKEGGEDRRVAHQTLPVANGSLYTAKFWIHPRTFRTCKSWEERDSALYNEDHPSSALD